MLHHSQHFAVSHCVVSSAAFLCVVQIAARPAHACSLMSNPPHTLDAQAQASDSTPPGVPRGLTSAWPTAIAILVGTFLIRRRRRNASMR